MSDPLDPLEQLLQNANFEWNEVVLDEFHICDLGLCDGLDDFADSEEFLAAVEANKTIVRGSFDLHDIAHVPEGEGAARRILQFVKTLCRRLPRLEYVTLWIMRDSPLNEVLEATTRLESIRIYDLDRVDGPSRMFPKLPRMDALKEHHNLKVFQYTCCSEPLRERDWFNYVIGTILMSVPYPSKLESLILSRESDAPQEFLTRFEDFHLSIPERTRLVELVQMPSLTYLALHTLCFWDERECIEFSYALQQSSIRHLVLNVCNVKAEHHMHIFNALFASKADLESLRLEAWSLENSPPNGTVDFSLPLGRILRRLPNLKSMQVEQIWGPCDRARTTTWDWSWQSRPVCYSTSCSTTRVLADLGTILSYLSAGSSMKFIKVVSPGCSVTELDEWLFKLPKEPLRLESLIVYGVDHSIPTHQQLETLLGILSRWLYLRTFELGKTGSFENHSGFEEQLKTFNRLNHAGRRYLAAPELSKDDGVNVLIRVRDNLNDLYTHLLENPSLCN